MGFDITGYVLRPPRSAPSNARGTAAANNGVVRDHANLPPSYDLPGTRVEVAADQYRAAVIENPDVVAQEYLFWAANSSNLAVVEDPSWAISEGAVIVPMGSLTVVDGLGTQTDGTDRLVVTDNDDRSIATVVQITIIRGDTLLPVSLTTFAAQDADAGVVVLNAGSLVLLGGGVSKHRGDTVAVLLYVLAAQRFWWTRNDADLQRFNWNGTTQRWEPIKGGSPISLGSLSVEGQYTLIPRLSHFATGAMLPGAVGSPDSYAMLRVGRRPDANSTPVRTLVVTDDEVAVPYAFPPLVDAVVGVTSGVLQFEATFIDAHAGQGVFYSQEQFIDGSTGILGLLKGSDLAPLFIAPIPGPTDLPFIRLGSRRPLRAIAVATEAALASQVVAEGEVGWAMSTGRLKLSAVDVAKADPDDLGFDLLYLGANVVYDGVSMTQKSVATRAPTQLVDSAGAPTTVDGSKDLFVPRATPLPSPGTSGVYCVPDGTGIVPTATAPSTRPNGSGLIRDVTSPGDLIVFGRQAALETTEVVEFEKDLPDFAFAIRKGRAVVAREQGAGGSQIKIGTKDRNRFNGEPLYFLQAEVQPLIYANQAQVFSRLREPFALLGTEVLAFAIDGVLYSWVASLLGTGEFTASVVAASLDSVVTGTGQVVAANGRVIIEAGNLDTGSVEIGFGSTTSGAFVDRDLSGCAVLGFLPGWRVDKGVTDSWLPDSGFVLGVSRSPQNLDRTNPTADLKARGRFRDAVLSNGVLGSSVFLLTNPPLLDVAGYDNGIFLQILDELYRKSLRPFRDVLYDLDQNRFSWADEGFVAARVESPTEVLPLGHTGVVDLTLHPAVGTGYGLYASLTGQARTLLSLGADYLVPDQGHQGIAVLVDVVGGLVTSGARGSFTAAGTIFTDPDATFLTDGVAPGYRLLLVGGPAAVQGSYIVASVSSETTLSVEAAVPFLETGATVSWELHTGFTTAVFDPGLIADVLYEEFNHLPIEPFTVRLVSSVGSVPLDAAAQALARLVAVAAEALAHERTINVRFGLAEGNPEAAITSLELSELGPMANDSLAVPDVADLHFTNANFSIRVGAVNYTIGTTLTGVSVFTLPLLGDQIEYGLPLSGVAGQLNFGEDTLASLSKSIVYYVQEFLDPAVLVGAEINPVDGSLNLSAADMTAHAGETAYFVEQMITKKRLDVVISPLQGSVFFNTPLRAGQIVEVDYTQADVSGNQADPTPIIEQLPLFVRLETASATADPYVYTFNPTGRTVRADISQVWINKRLKNYGNVTDYTIEASLSEIRFVVAPAVGSIVQINYAVVEAFGGERSYTVSSPPVYRPPFLMLANQGSFNLQGDRTVDMVPGKLLRVGSQPFYIQSAIYTVIEDTTQVSVFPTPLLEAGSRAPGNDATSLLTSAPVTTLVNSTPTAGPAGFMITVTTPYQPADKGMLFLTFLGDVVQYAQPEHLMELGGHPYIIAGSVLSTDGLTTTVTLTTPLRQSYNLDVVKLSVRQIYPSDARTLDGLGGAVSTEPIEVVLFGETLDGTPLPGRTLTRGVQYDIDEASGGVTLLAPTQAALQPGQRVVVSFTHRRKVSPFVVDRTVVFPTYSAKYVHITTPDDKNGYLDATLVATYTFSSPDSFYVRAVPMSTWMGEVAQTAVNRVASRTPHGGPVVVSGPPTGLYTHGTVPLLAERRDLLDQDRAAREFITVYDDFIVAFEQVKETLDGTVVGDRDGKFRFFVGRGKVYGGPGYEDSITGYLQSRDVWSQVFEAANGSFGVTPLDPVVDPTGASQDPVTREVTGNHMDPWTLDFYIRQQRALVRNDMDDLILAAKARGQLRRDLTPGFLSFKMFGDFRGMWQPSVVSRLFPERTVFFTTTYPGIEAGTLPANPGEYAFLKMVKVDTGVDKFLKRQKVVAQTTFHKEIADISNPVLGLITNITEKVDVLERLPRARIWDYSETGYGDIDPASDGMPAVIATPLFLRDFPLDPATGNPDLTQLTANGGLLSDLSTGDSELSNPPWVVVDKDNDVLPQVAFGHPDGTLVKVGMASGTFNNAFSGGITFDPVFKGVFIGQVLSGCILTFAGEDGSPIKNAADLIIVGPDGTTVPFSVTRGDTVYVTNPDALDPSTLSDPPKQKELRKFSKNQPYLKVGVKERSSSVVDHPAVFPSLFTGDNHHARPLMTIESEVEFANSSRSPLKFPALSGEPTNDYGDYGIPYLATTNTELDRLGAVQGTFTSITQTDSPLPGAVYPDEVLGNDGSIISPASGITPPATLTSTRDFIPVAPGPYTPHSGVGDVRQLDLLLVEVGQAGLSAGATGILSVGAVGDNQVEVPRFVTQTLKGDRIRYILNNAMVHLTTTGLTGLVVTQVGPNTLITSTAAAPLFNDGSGAAVGGLNNVFAGAFPGNLVTIRLISQTTGLVVETITYDGSTGFITGGSGAVATAAPTAVAFIITVPAIGFVTNLGTQFDFTVTINTFNGGAVTAGSTTAYVLPDRLTFETDMDLTTVRPRGDVTLGGFSVEGGLRVSRITASGNDGCTVDAAPEVNANTDLTFLPRSSVSPVIGTFVPSPGSGEGTVKVMAWEAQGNLPVLSTAPVTFSAVPSSDQDAAGPILSGTATSLDTTNSLRTIVVGTGSVAKVVAGDVVTVAVSATGDAAVKAGTYLVRHTVVENPAASGYSEVSASAAAGAVSGWATSPWPTVVSASTGPFRLVASGVLSVPQSPSTYNFDSAGTVYVIKDQTNLDACLAVDYTAISVVGDEITFTLTGGSARLGDGTAVGNGAFVAAVSAGQLVSGMVFLPIQRLLNTPTNNLVGFDHGVTTVGGFLNVTATGSGGAVTWTTGADLVDSTGGVPAATQLGVWVSDAPGGTFTEDSTVFYADPATLIYEDVPFILDLRGVDPVTQWDTLHGTVGSQIQCLVPGDTLATVDGGGAAAFRAVAGIFLEPSVPRPTIDIGGGTALVVDAVHSLTTAQVGMRDAAAFGLSTSEDVSFIVKRIRRFHSVLDGIGTNLAPLRFAYEIRTGTVASYGPVGFPYLGFSFVATGGGTQLGGFDDPNVNVNPGDLVRILDVSGNVVDTAEVAFVPSATALILRAPGFAESPPTGGETFQVYLRQAPVPHVQSNEQLLGIITDRVVFTSVANPTTGDGGRVDVVNVLKDPSVTDFTLLGIQEGDIILVDSAGALAGATGPATPLEHGERPFGDQSVSTRTDGSYIAGGPGDLDDNRGWYRVTAEPTSTDVPVDGTTAFTGPDGVPVLFGALAPTNQQFAVVPDITGSGLTGNTEGQMDLRPTHPADGSNSYQDGSFKSIEPFSYKIIRPSRLISEESVDLVLLMRERMLSFLEEMDAALSAQKQGSYFVFQRDEHASDLGSATNGDDGLGVPSNVFISGLSGLTQFAPFANVSDCLSVLDRRYWCLDIRLDKEVPPYSVAGDPYSSFESDNSTSGYTVGSGRPVEPDLIDDVLDRTDRLRELRYAWIGFRTDQVDGTLPAIIRFDAELPRRLAEQEQLLRLQESFDSAGGS